MNIIIIFKIISFNKNTNNIKIIYFLTTNIYKNILVYLKYIIKDILFYIYL